MASDVPQLERSILVVDDEPMIRLNLADFFEDEGYTVYEASDADAAIAILQANSGVRIVLTDIQMPGSMDGVKLAHFIAERFPPSLLIVASGALRPSAAELPPHTMFIAKPFDPRRVLDEIERLA
ncbi:MULTISPECIES: response regulator [unclassified Sphingomonas]|uniref:response regulator n=1 Tax=unclassified Sphingomonas TaxID=196159 RepID=UPI001F57E337|nr:MULTISPECIES: response regulator [unclassified Sphingomonas]